MALVIRQESTKEENPSYSVRSVSNSPDADGTHDFGSESDSALLMSAQKVTSKDASYILARDIFARCLAIVYFISFLGHYKQDVGLVGEEGVWPAGASLAKIIEGIFEDGILSVNDRIPGVFSVLPICDVCVWLLAVAGMIISLLIILTGIIGCGTCLTLWLIEFSLVSLMVNLPKHNSDLLLLEAGFLAIFLFSPFMVFEKQGGEWELPLICRWAFRFLVYRVMFCAGISKIRGTGHWVDSTAFKYLLQSVTIPNPITYYLYNLMVSYPTANMLVTNTLLFVECVASVFLLVPMRSCTILGGIIAIIYALFFNIIGNFGYFYLLLAACAIFCFDDEILEKIVGCPCKSDEEDALKAVDDEEAQSPGCGHEQEGFTARIMRIIKWGPKKCSHGEDVVYLHLLGVECDDNPYHRMLENLQVLIVFLISFVMFNMILGRPYIGLKVVIVFFLALQLNVFDILDNDLGLLHVWSTVGLNEVGAGLSNAASKLHKICRVMMQLVVLTSLVCYAFPLMIQSINFRNPGTGFRAPFGIVNSYDGFGIIPEERRVLLIQGTDENVVGANTQWKTYELHGVPGDVNKQPSFVLGYNYELDNLIHDINKKNIVGKPKTVSIFMLEFIRALLHNKENVSKLLAYNPFHQQAPKYIRVIQYRYQFSGTNDNTWYKREFVGQMIPPLTLERLNESDHHAEVTKEQHDAAKAQDKPHSDAAPKASNVFHVVHKMPPTRNIRGVPLDMAENFVKTAPVTDSLMLTRV